MLLDINFISNVNKCNLICKHIQKIQCPVFTTTKTDLIKLKIKRLTSFWIDNQKFIKMLTKTFKIYIEKGKLMHP